MYSKVPEYDVAFSTVHELYYRQLYNYAKGIIKDSFEAEIIVNDVFIAAYQKREDFTVGAKIYPLLKIMSRNRCIDYIRRRRSAEKRAKKFAYVPDTQTDGIPPYELMETKAEFMEIVAVMYEELNRMPKKSRAILRATILEGRSCEEYARADGIEAGSARNLQAFALEHLKKRMLARGFNMLLILLVLMLVNAAAGKKIKKGQNSLVKLHTLYAISIATH